MARKKVWHKRSVLSACPKNWRSWNFIRKQYSESWAYIKDVKNFIYISMGLFFLFVLIGAFLPTPLALEETLREMIRKLILETEGMSQKELTTFILLNNLESSFLGIFYGIILGIFPVASAVLNGYLVGFVAAKSVEAGSVFVLWRILPHGIFELPALFLSLGMGLKLGTFIFQKEKFKSLGVFLTNSLKVFLLVVIPLLIVAAIIEGALIFFV